jgi:hypothetical protein
MYINPPQSSISRLFSRYTTLTLIFIPAMKIKIDACSLVGPRSFHDSAFDPSIHPDTKEHVTITTIAAAE